MYTINRSICVIKPKAPCIEWVNSLPDTDEPFTLEESMNDCTAILLPEFDVEENINNYIKHLFAEIFEMELEDWCTNKNKWPQNRTYQLFLDWFEIEIHSTVFDPFEDNIKKEKYVPVEKGSANIG
ncbi:MAG: hypothetical protein OMM_07926 [Candidatus Magnetoglobus multicellularis str. Araruama]|uniref:VacJ n=1 Tax=Candidatus Magnetoglobus multicellularis str. Araruama TaxID=890399 RepID=A0A1V1PAB5_9BACT|nr:MAG: hypothetical protein OMM_07926 [Candidatus Magnetoglobus multicellularis str. Araruama]